MWPFAILWYRILSFSFFWPFSREPEFSCETKTKTKNHEKVTLSEWHFQVHFISIQFDLILLHTQGIRIENKKLSTTAAEAASAATTFPSHQFTTQRVTFICVVILDPWQLVKMKKKKKKRKMKKKSATKMSLFCCAQNFLVELKSNSYCHSAHSNNVRAHTFFCNRAILWFVFFSSFSSHLYS